MRRKRLVAPNFADLADLAAKIEKFIDEWNEVAHPFNWTAASFTRNPEATVLEELQEPIEWSNTEVVVRVNRGSFSVDDEAWLFEKSMEERARKRFRAPGRPGHRC